ncbi:type II toxin-antitoxin system prevent-host-death family antitoxin [Escherichia coli]|nr:type II toxin-antitoxin system prevent-host-death family antitoxin [Escherichia coli]
MRKVSYTQMRAELSDILDAIRNGETIVVTQRGRPDTVLNGSLNIEHEHPRRHYSGYTVVEGGGKKRVFGSNNKLELKSGDIVHISFGEALAKTQKKHAKIIKALEDK